MNSSTRKKLIREVADADRNINARLSKIQRKTVRSIPEEVEPFYQIGQEEIDNMKVAITVLKQLLEKKTLLVKQFVHQMADYANSKDSIMDIAQIEEVLTAYNSVVAIYMNPKNTQETRSHIQRMFATLDDMVNDLAEGTLNIVSYVKMRSMPNAQLILKAYTLYDMIKEQFDKNNFYQISNDDIKHDLQLKRQQLRQPSRQNYAISQDSEEERPAVVVPYERENEGSVASIPRLGSVSLRSSRSGTRDLPPLEPDSEEDEPERTELTFAVPDKDMNELGDISHDALKRAYKQLNSVRRQNNQQPLGLPVANLDEMSPYELQSLLIPLCCIC